VLSKNVLPIDRCGEGDGDGAGDVEVSESSPAPSYLYSHPLLSTNGSSFPL
jgi:hypothetical protein